MDRVTIKNYSILSEKGSPAEFGSNDLQAGFLPSIILPESYKGKTGKVFCSGYTQEAEALHWALNRLAGWDLPGKEHVEEYFRSMYRGISDRGHMPVS